MIIEIIELYIWISVLMTVAFYAHFLADFSINVDEIEFVATTCWFLKPVLNLFRTINIQERELCVMIEICL